MSAAAQETLSLHDFGLAEYGDILALQKDFVRKRLADEIPDMILVGQHQPVITTGRGTHPENLLNPKLPVFEIERGGDVTYHGPGQLIAYPIIKLESTQRDLHKYLRNLEEVIILTLAEFGIEGQRRPGMTGIWVNDAQKIASIGVAVKQWVTYHGLALNISTDLAEFSSINPCGFSSNVMTRMTDLTHNPMAFTSVQQTLIKQASAVLLNR